MRDRHLYGTGAAALAVCCAPLLIPLIGLTGLAATAFTLAVAGVAVAAVVGVATIVAIVVRRRSTRRGQAEVGEP